MKKDINPPKVEDIAVAILQEENDEGTKDWNVYVINLKDTDIEKVLVSSSGYGTDKGQKVETSMLRRFYEGIPANSYLMIEPIMEEVFKLSNQYWVSFFIGDQMYDKKYVFVPDSIDEKNFIDLPLIGKRGVMIK